MKKVTEKDIADALGISRVSVWKVLSKREGTSVDLKNRVIQKALDMGYPVPEELLPQPTTPETVAPLSDNITIAVAVSRPETSIFWLDILHQIAKEAAKNNISLLYTYLPTEVTPDYQLPPQLSTAQGFVVLNVYNAELLKLLSALDTPKVFMDTVPSLPFRKLSGDLILIEGRSGMEEITTHLISKGIHKIGFIGDINYAQTNFERYYGFTQAMKEHDLPIDPDYCLPGPIEANSYAEEISHFLDSLKKMPEAFLCVSDFVANLLYQELIARNYQIPQDIAVAGFDGNREFAYSGKLTTVEVNTHDLGKRLAKQLIHRITNPNFSKEITYLCPEVRFNESTDIKPTK